MRERQVSQIEEQGKRRRGSILKIEDTKLKKEKIKHMSETTEMWRETMPKQTIKEAIHLDVIIFKSVVLYLEVRQRHSQIK
jgi:hypothetical protein